MADAGSFSPAADYTRTEMVDLRYDDTIGLRDSIGKKLSLRARIVRVDSDSTSFWMLEGDKSCPSPFFRHGESAAPARLRFTKLDPTLEIVMRMLVKTDQLFDGGVTLIGAETLSGRAGNQTCGTVEIGYVRYLDTVFTR
ncbi:MAG: hypothetical protein HY770_00685 [Chitinivibrionia bacterium]|nr:hypothetical protein [Chitinivibrionia bacterium]